MSRSRIRRDAGFGLIELMISLLLGLLVLGAAIAVFQSNQRTFGANEGQNRIQEGARAAYEMMSRDIRAAGGTACSKLARPDEEHTYTADETNLLIAPISGTGSEFTVLSGDDASYQVTAATTSSVTIADPSPLPPGWKLSDGFKAGDKLLLCNATLMYVVTISGGGVNDAAKTLAFSPATPEPIYDPGNAPAASVSAARFRTARWYLNAGSLYTSRNGVAEAVVPGVTALNVSYRQDDGVSYTTAPSWPDVVAVRVNLTLRGQQTTGGDVQVDGSNYITRSTSNITAVRSRAP
ncbi:MAG TPA: prepilin-type N-terminal cleavage/methylation domain-containing protein [Thermomonas sp.]|nr:prepilin-type N-terminal cleavage/methylation domain-containing protein [Thermomonas sp.]